MSEAFVNSPLGTLVIQGDESGLQRVEFKDEKIPQSENIPVALEDAVFQLSDYFEGKRKNFDLKLNPQGTDFQKRVWLQLAEIPFGKTTSYLQMAKDLGDPKVIRAAASANGKNPIAIIIPCHRVIGSDNSMTGYAGGIWRKKWLLEHESPVTQQVLF
ncbi:MULTISPECIES: methylated-DNA--[protein]-cysteine S-methyltransferase [unclassified Leeuwenhoekiella]|uniref:methylated-DNA--[protein]-cysteine S-methyltransferase n=1 Tax=unclassified Leeuwenhoekiella TaxID=2615029 RepID=UPI000C4FF1E3|nr:MULTISPECIES: methylated-DNA--[protein]-cysteine S-methyltransferase [unclassified Leeuwenhoekiella]MAW96071.1 cysteine methyltransferase [Leeuwenhoekiella sp.]MBA80065.1 cysteine methyltransferase [Leeuwenhoekiella sp.]|tara:strand:- start:16868 stop:17341 length:474 start_codon:yes stop_codon:yes gene_type:complete